MSIPFRGLTEKKSRMALQRGERAMRGEGGGLLGLLQIGAGQVLAQRLVGDGEDH